MTRILILCLLLVVGSKQARADYQENCERVAQPLDYQYCSLVEPSSNSTDVIFYFHGSGGDAHEASKLFPKYLNYWKSHGFNAPIIISLSFGANWYLTPKFADIPDSGLLEAFTDQIMNDLELRVLGHTATRRSVVGVSMGGVNAALLMLSDRPHAAIAKYGMLAPGLVDLSPWASDDQIASYAEKYGSDKNLLSYIGELSQSLVPSESSWTAISPMVRITNPPDPDSQLFIMGNAEDKNFFHGAERFAEEAIKSMNTVKWVIWPGGHSQFDWTDSSLPEFLIR